MNSSAGCSCDKCSNTSSFSAADSKSFFVVFSQFFIYILIAIGFVWFVYPLRNRSTKRGKMIGG
jgi:hypothetical protein